MIKTFACKDTESLYEGSSPRKFQTFKQQAERKLQMLDSAEDIMDLRSPPGNHLEKLSGKRAEQWQWRICFEWRDNVAWNVEIVDYH